MKPNRKTELRHGKRQNSHSIVSALGSNQVWMWCSWLHKFINSFSLKPVWVGFLILAVKRVLAKSTKKSLYFLKPTLRTLTQSFQWTQYLIPGNDHSRPQLQRKYRDPQFWENGTQRIPNTAAPAHPQVTLSAGKQALPSGFDHLRQIPTIGRNQYEGQEPWN